jgi:hypothetical protein
LELQSEKYLHLLLQVLNEVLALGPDLGALVLLEILILLLQQELLLRPEDGARAADPDPADEVGGGEAVVLHRVDPDERTRAAEARLAVHRHRGVVVLAGAEELVDDGLGASERTEKNTSLGVDPSM